MDGLKAMLACAAVLLVLKNIELMIKLYWPHKRWTPDSLRIFTVQRQYHFDPKIPRYFFMRLGQKVRFVQMDGCMAHIRGYTEEGRIVGFTQKKVYGDTQMRPYARIKFADRIVEWVAEPHEWFPGNDGVLERKY